MNELNTHEDFSSQKTYTETSAVVRVKHRHNKGKAIPLQAWTGPEGSRRLRFPDFMTVGK